MKRWRLKVKDRPVRVVIVDNAVDPRVYRPVAHWRRWLDVPAEAFVAREGRFPDLDGGVTHLILTGSEASILDRAPWAETEARLVRDAVARGAAVLGSCWGHQLLAYALAGEACVRRAAAPEVGWIQIRVLEGGDILGEAGEAWTFAVHFDEVAGLDGRFEILAESDGCGIQGFRLRGRPVWGIQPHPEIDPEEGRATLRAFLARGFAAAARAEAALRAGPRDSGLIRTIVRVFLESSGA